MSCEVKDAKIKEGGEHKVQLSPGAVTQWLLSPRPHTEMSHIFLQPLPSVALVAKAVTSLAGGDGEEGSVTLIAPGSVTVFSCRADSSTG